MRVYLYAGLALALVTLPKAVSSPQEVAAGHSVTALRVLVQGDTSRLPDFVASLRKEMAGHAMSVDMVEPGQPFDYNILIAQETTFGSAVAAVIVLDTRCVFVASVVRSGRFSGKGAFNASAKELAKKIADLRGLP